MEYLNFQEANCQNCYKCIRTCKVKAIKIDDKQAKIVPDLCVGCGECFDICPQNAKSVKTDVEFVKDMLKTNKKVVVSLAPSFPSYDKMDNPLQFISALRELGFDQIEETTIGAVNVSKKYREDYYGEKKHIITTSCPTVNTMVTKYYPHLAKYLSECISPMMAHNNIIRKREDDVYTVFIGPCISKKEETSICYSKDSCIDAVITFDDIRFWLTEENININELEPSNFDFVSPSLSRWYPLSGGVEKASLNEDTSERRVLKVDGMEACVELLDCLDELESNTWIEMNACKEGCINGFGNSQSPLKLHKKIDTVINYINHETQNSYDYVEVDTFFDYTTFNPVSKTEYSDSEIQSILHKTGKYTKEDELNCGACGYNTCRSKAEAVLNNMAEIEMCLPYMRMKNEAVSSVIIENTPNGIIVADKEYQIVEFNPSSVNLFMISKMNAMHKHVEEVIGENVFGYVRHDKPSTALTKTLKKSGKTVIMTMKYIKNHKLYLGIFKDITQQEIQKRKHKEMSIDALDMAQNVIDKQMRVAHEIASLLGETTAETKVTLSKLKRLFDEQV
ncbi:Iron hydrogenase 1 [Candidatus Izimaplasma bacterium HR1]|jgi:iron only hydrogenase large subunit-like protein/uncharacterized Fe-S cluster-containing protein|uniref:[Fe-Fe] hydrogenase large subunit C-terminal domain-containing protein n=1 Tax=Candidatus Izimoplasma sp. HR1 TaxID=1541959 RepID=UPI0004F6C223|nr:Iron hydrogenase 1 [Candidatus Izimaplasma bacterium HR1]